MSLALCDSFSGPYTNDLDRAVCLFPCGESALACEAGGGLCGHSGGGRPDGRSAHRAVLMVRGQSATDVWFRQRGNTVGCGGRRPSTLRTRGYSQDVGDDAHRPHVRRVADGVEVDDLGRHELWRPEQHLQLLRRVETARQAEVNDLDPVARLGETEDVFWLWRQIR